MVLLFPSNGALRFVLTRRSDQVAAHKGQVSLPGGGRQAGETLQQTALREAGEELGIDAGTAQVLGRLSPLYVPVSNYCVHPFVGYAASAPVLQPNPDEVAAVLEVPLSALLDKANRGVQYWDEPGFGGGRRIPCFSLGGWLVWGATAMILAEMAAVLEAA
jgi:8-oxo-dGTP pyrophosphatase MutT (NUDIX family)